MQILGTTIESVCMYTCLHTHYVYVCVIILPRVQYVRVLHPLYPTARASVECVCDKINMALHGSRVHVVCTFACSSCHGFVYFRRYITPPPSIIPYFTFTKCTFSSIMCICNFIQYCMYVSLYLTIFTVKSFTLTKLVYFKILYSLEIIFNIYFAFVIRV